MLNIFQSRSNHHSITYFISIDPNTYFDVILSLIKHLEHVYYKYKSRNTALKMFMLCNVRLNILQSRSNHLYLSLLRLAGCVFLTLLVM